MFLFQSEFIILICITNATHGKLIILMNEEFEDCTEGGPAKYIDWSGLEYDYVNDTTYFLNGQLKFLKTIKSPWTVHFFIEKYDRLQWHKQIVDRHVIDLCPVLQNPLEPWYYLTGHFKHKTCPFEAGHTEKFNNEKFAEVPHALPYSMIGKYRASLISHFTDEHRSKITECARTEVEIMEG